MDARFSLDGATSYMAGLADRTPAQKSTTDTLQLLAVQFAAILGMAAEAGFLAGDPDQAHAALDHLDAAIGAVFKALCPPAPPPAQEGG